MTISRKEMKRIDVFKPHRWQIPVLNSIDEVILLTGSAGGGKSRVAAEKIHAFLMTFPGATALVVRKTRTSMYNSTVVFLRKEVMGKMLTSKRIRHNSTQHRFEYWNGSMLIYGGMKDDQQKEAIRSIGQHGGIDICWMEEATQFEEADFNEVISRMRGNVADWRQIILTTNPDSPNHWIYQRMIIGNEATKFFSKASDNSANPADYESKLDRLTGIERDRLRDGEWREAGGLVFDQWKENPDDGIPGNVTNEAEYIPGGGPVMWWVDDGYSGEYDSDTGFFRARSHPRVFLFVQQRSDGTFAIFDESYQVQMLAPAHIDEVIGHSVAKKYAKPSRVVYDRAAASLGRHLHDELGQAWGIPKSAITYNRVPVDEGNKEVNTWIAADENRVRKIIVNPRCRHLRLEMVTYKADPKTGRVVKDFDHGPDCIRMGLWDFLHGISMDVDVSGSFEVDLEHVQPDSDGILEFEDGDVSIAAITSIDFVVV